MDATVRKDTLTGTRAGSGEAASLVESALLLRWRAPELALLLAERAAAADAGPDEAVRAGHLAASGLNCLGRDVEAAERIADTLLAVPAGHGEDLTIPLHVELALCAGQLGDQGTALAAAARVLGNAAAVGSLRATALIAVAESLGGTGRTDEVPLVLDEATRLFEADPEMDADTKRLQCATVRAVAASVRRRLGDPAMAEAEARTGQGLLAELSDPDHDGGQTGGRLLQELVLALLDQGKGDAALQASRGLLNRPTRAAAAGPTGWVRLALATRVHIPAGRHEPALTLLADGVEGAQRYGMDAVLAECLDGLSYVHEVRGELLEALHCVRSSRAAERRRREATDGALARLHELVGDERTRHDELTMRVLTLVRSAEPAHAHRAQTTDLADHQTAHPVGAPHEVEEPQQVETVQPAEEVVPDVGPDVAPWEGPAGVLDAGEYVGRVDAALGDAPSGMPMSLVIVELDDGASADADVVDVVAERLRRVSPADALLGRLDAERAAVLLPGKSRSAARTWAELFRVSASRNLATPMRIGVAEHRPGARAAELIASGGRAVAAMATVTGPEPQPPIQPTVVQEQQPPLGAEDTSHARPTGDTAKDEPVTGARHDEPAHTGPADTPPRQARHGRQAGTAIPVTDLLGGSVPAGGRSARRRAQSDQGERPTGSHEPASHEPADVIDRPEGDPAERPAGRVADASLNGSELVNGWDRTASADTVGADPESQRSDVDADIHAGIEAVAAAHTYGAENVQPDEAPAAAGDTGEAPSVTAHATSTDFPDVTDEPEVTAPEPEPAEPVHPAESGYDADAGYDTDPVSDGSYREGADFASSTLRWQPPIGWSNGIGEHALHFEQQPNGSAENHQARAAASADPAADSLSTDPPPAPEPRPLEWSPVDDGGTEAPSRDVGLGDLLAEALAAFQEGRTSGAERPAEREAEDEHTAEADLAPDEATAQPQRDDPAWASPREGVQDTVIGQPGAFPPPALSRQQVFAEALTDPVLMLDDPLGESMRRPRGPGPRSAAGE